MKNKLKYISLCVLGAFFTSKTVAQELYQMSSATSSHVSSMENLNGPKGEGGQTNHGAKGNPSLALKPGQTQTLLDVQGSGIIQRFWITMWDRSPEMLRGIRLRMYWDDNAVPAVDVPLGDFFCLGLGQQAAFENALFSTAEGRSFNCYIPMPFRKGAKVTVTNETGKLQQSFFFDVDFVKTKHFGSNDMFFHASWTHQDHKPVPEDIDLLPKIEGKGRFLGVSVGLNANPSYGDVWWGEGEVKMYIDGDEQYPTINGTGAEDYIGSGWMEGVFVNRFQGCLFADTKGGHFSFYRFHIPDQIVFDNNFHATMQQLGGGGAGQVRDLIKKGVNIRPVTIWDPNKFTTLLDSEDPKGDLEKANANDWVCFNSSNDYAVTAYYYLNHP